MPIAEAARKATDIIEHQVPVVSVDSHTSVLLSAKEFKDHRVDIENAKAALQNYQSTPQFADLVANLDFKTLAPFIKTAPSLREMLTFSSSLKTKSKEGKRIVAENFYNRFKNNIRIFNNPNDMNTLMVELHDNFGHKIPMFIRNKNGQLVRGKLNAIQMAETAKEKDIISKNRPALDSINHLNIGVMGGF